MKHNDYVIENVTDAFLALKDIDDDEVASMIKPKRRMTEGKSFSINASNDELEKAREFLKRTQTETALQVIDPDADSIEHIKSKEAYVGQAILQCARCGAKRFIDTNKLAPSEKDHNIFNVAEECPNCKIDGEGFELIGQVGKMESPAAEEESKPKDKAKEAAPEKTEEAPETDTSDLPTFGEVEDEPAELPTPSSDADQAEEPAPELSDNAELDSSDAPEDLDTLPDQSLTPDEEQAFALPDFEDASAVEEPVAEPTEEKPEERPEEEQNESYEEDNEDELTALRDRDEQGLNNDMGPSDEEKKEHKPKLKLKFKEDLDPDANSIRNVDEGFTVSEFREFLTLCKKIGIVTISDLEKFKKENKGEILTALRDYNKKLSRELGPDYSLKEDLLLDMNIKEPVLVIPEESQEADSCVEQCARDVMAAYQNSARWLDTIKESVYYDLSCPVLANYIHEIAHKAPQEFDSFGAILHTANIEIPYPATEELEGGPENIVEAIDATMTVLDQIKKSLTAFIKCADKDYHGMSCSAEELLIKIDAEYPMLYRMLDNANKYINDTVAFEKYLLALTEHKADLLD